MMANKQWKPSNILINTLHPSTSKSHVLPRLNPSVIGRNEVIQEMFNLEKQYAISKDYFKTVQTEVTPVMRKVLLEWMMEVCDEERCSCEVFVLAASYVDRFLSVECVHKQQLQSLGTACLFIASKVKLVNPFTASRLVEYTDHGVTVSEILSWELLILNRLNWDVSTLTTFDFLDQYIHRLNLPNDLILRLRGYLNHFSNITAIDFPTATMPPSLIAASCLQVACMVVFGDVQIGIQVVKKLNELLGIDTDAVHANSFVIYDLYTKRQPDPLKGSIPLSTDSLRVEFGDCVISKSKGNTEYSDSGNDTFSLTPTDVEDVMY